MRAHIGGTVPARSVKVLMVLKVLKVLRVARALTDFNQKGKIVSTVFLKISPTVTIFYLDFKRHEFARLRWKYRNIRNV